MDELLLPRDQQLLPRDQPLERGRRLHFEFTLSYDVVVDDDVLQGEPTATLDEIEELFGHSSEQILHELRRAGYDLGDVTHSVALTDIAGSLRFASRYEVADRHEWWMRGKQVLDSIPSVLDENAAAADLARGLMAGDAATFKAGYSRENALIAALEVFGHASRDEVERLLDGAP